MKQIHIDCSQPARLIFSRHALHRSQKRAIPREVAERIFFEWDHEEPAGGDCILIRFSKSQLKALAKEGLTPTMMSWFAKAGVIYSNRTEQIVTVMHMTETAAKARQKRA